MPMYDRNCPKCKTIKLDCWENIETSDPICPTCNIPTERIWISKSSSVIQDSIEGGIKIRHGLCNEDGSPRTYYSKSEIAAEAKRRDLVNIVRHVPDGKSGDKSKHTTRWI